MLNFTITHGNVRNANAGKTSSGLMGMCGSLGVAGNGSGSQVSSDQLVGAKLSLLTSSWSSLDDRAWNIEERKIEMKHAYIEKNFRKSSVALIDQANEIIEDYQAEGYDLTLRQLYYQFVARDIIPNRQTEYKKLGSVINDARLAGLIDWESIVDRTRSYEALGHWDDPAGILRSAALSYGIDTRSDQEDYVEVWVEKDALVGVIEKACSPLDVGYLSCRGFVSQSAMWRAAQRFMDHEPEQNTILIHLGDHDPSGVDMTRDIQDRLEMFGSSVEVKRIALNMDQIEEYNPPPNPVKFTDSRSGPYIAEYGDKSWELDALDPRVLVELITEEVDHHTLTARRRRRIKKQEDDREKIQAIADDWN